MLKTVVKSILPQYFGGNPIFFFLVHVTSFMFEIYVFYSIMNAFTVTFDQFKC